MHLLVVTPPLPVVTLTEAKAHLRRDDEDDNDLVAAYLAAAQGSIDGPPGWLGRALGLQTLELHCEGFLGLDCLTLPCPPFVDMVSIGYRDHAGAWQMLDPALVETTPWGRIQAVPGQTWPTPLYGRSTVRIRYRAGYPDMPGEDGAPATSTLPAPIRAAILMMTADLYENRDGKIPANLVENRTVEALLSPFRVWA